jgi:hypothetical protein
VRRGERTLREGKCVGDVLSSQASNFARTSQSYCNNSVLIVFVLASE